MAAIECLGGAGTVTGSKFLVDSGRRRLLVDCGLFQGLKDLRLRNWAPLPVDPARIDAVVLTHAHIDHAGYLPRLCREGFSGPIYATRGTADLLRIMLPDSGHLQEEEAAYHNKRGSSKHRPALPLYTAEEGRTAADRVTAVHYDVPLELGPGLRVLFRRAGHILGSAVVSVDIEHGRRLVFSGDLGRYDAPILMDPATLGEADYVLIESTYGDRWHTPDPIPAQLERTITAALGRGGVVIIPAFAVGRVQELLYHLEALERAGRVPALPTYLDSPMAIEATTLYATHPEEFDEDMRRLVESGITPLRRRRVHLARSTDDSKAINALRGPVLIIAGSGMATGGRVLHHLRRRLPDPATTVLLVGYQAPGTRGRRLQDGAESIRIFGEEVPVRGRVETIHGLSAHADQGGLLRWLKTAARPPRCVLVVHGDPGPAETLATRVREELGWHVVVPAYRERVELE